MAIQTDFISAVNQICAERGIEKEDVLEAIESAMLAGYKKDYMGGESLKVEIDETQGKIKVLSDKKVVDVVSDPGTQISLEKAQLIEPKLKVGDHIEVDVTPEGDFGRVAAQAAKQVILQKIREAEKEAVMEEFKDKVGTVESAVVQRMDGDSVIVEIRKAVAQMPLEEQIRGEYYRSGQRMKVLIRKIQRTMKGQTLIVSRSAPEFLGELFKLEVPEVVSGSIEIKAIAREAGSRSKVAVWSTQEGVDPIGSCVGQKGVRITAIQNELKTQRGEEKIDIILWDEDAAKFIQNSLSPAQVASVEVDEKKKEAKVIVPDDQLSLAIGKEGQNVRLAAKLTGWRIDIRGESQPGESVVESGKETEKKKKKTEEKSEFEKLGLSTRIVNALKKAGIETVKDLKKKIEKGEKIKGVGKKSLEEIETRIGTERNGKKQK